MDTPVVNAVDTGSVNKKGAKIYYTIRTLKNGSEKKSFFTLSDRPAKIYLSKSTLQKMNMSFVSALIKDDSTVHEASVGGN